MFDGSEPAPAVAMAAGARAKAQSIEMAKRINIRHRKDNKVIGFVQLIRPAVESWRVIAGGLYAW
jgi:hypothetical protein